MHENSAAVTAVQATHPEGLSVSYSISGGQDQALFTINGTTGALEFTAAPDFEAPGCGAAADSNTCIVIVSAADSRIPPLTDSQTITVNVLDVNEAPVITSDLGGSDAAKTVPENNAAVTTVQATDPENGTMTYSVSGGADRALFTVGATSGALAFTDAPDYEAAPCGGTTSGDKRSCVVAVSATDDGYPVLADSQTITVNIADENDNTPVITSGGTVNTEENGTAVTTVAATDADSAAITTLRFSISDGADRDLFSINNASGALAFTTAPGLPTPRSGSAPWMSPLRTPLPTPIPTPRLGFTHNLEKV